MTHGNKKPTEKLRWVDVACDALDHGDRATVWTLVTLREALAVKPETWRDGRGWCLRVVDTCGDDHFLDPHQAGSLAMAVSAGQVEAPTDGRVSAVALLPLPMREGRHWVALRDPTGTPAPHRTPPGEDDARRAAAILDRGQVVWNKTGVALGVTYYDGGTRSWYAATLKDCRALMALVDDGRAGAYSVWCCQTVAEEHPTRHAAEAELVDGE